MQKHGRDRRLSVRSADDHPRCVPICRSQKLRVGLNLQAEALSFQQLGIIWSRVHPQYHDVNGFIQFIGMPTVLLGQ